MRGAMGRHQLGRRRTGARTEDEHGADFVNRRKHGTFEHFARVCHGREALLGCAHRGVPYANGVEIPGAVHPGAGPVARTPSFSALTVSRSCSASVTSEASSTRSTGTPSTTG